MWFLPSFNPQREEEREWRVLPVKFYELEVKGMYITSTFPWPEFNCMAMLTAKKSGKCSPSQERREKDLASVMKFSCSHTSPELSPSNLLVIREKRLSPPCLRLFVEDPCHCLPSAILSDTQNNKYCCILQILTCRKLMFLTYTQLI